MQVFNGVIFVLFNFILLVGGIGIGVVLIVLQIKLALRGIKALDIYILKNSQNRISGEKDQ